MQTKRVALISKSERFDTPVSGRRSLTPASLACWAQKVPALRLRERFDCTTIRRWETKCRVFLYQLVQQLDQGGYLLIPWS